jgi:MFS family permease
MCQAASRSFEELAVLRVLSGAAEATADPAFVLITATWYTRQQQPARIGAWYAANGIGIALGGLLGYGIGQIPGTSALKAPWQWEFILIGAACALWAAVMCLFIPDAPHNRSRWLTDRQRALVVARKRDDHAGGDSRKWRWDQAAEALIDPKFYLFFLFGLSGFPYLTFRKTSYLLYV